MPQTPNLGIVGPIIPDLVFQCHRLACLLWDTVVWQACLCNACPRAWWHRSDPWNHLGVVGNDGQALFGLREGMAMPSTDGGYVNTLIWAAINANFGSPSK